MTAVLYSLMCDAGGGYERQWQRSVASLRRQNRDIKVTLCLYGGAGAETLQTARRLNVSVVEGGEYAQALGDIPPHWRQALAALQLHKLISVARVAQTAGEPLLYLDCDTYFFGDVATLGERYAAWDWAAREEPGSARSPHGSDPGYLDEPALARIAAAEGLAPVPPYNTGVFRVSRRLAETLAALVDDFVWYAWRLLLGACLWRPELVSEPWLAAFVREHARVRERRLALRYPSSNFWILDQVAIWLTLGRVPGLAHGLLARGDVAQNGEYADGSDCIVAHYYSAGEAAFLAHLTRRDAAAARA